MSKNSSSSSSDDGLEIKQKEEYVNLIPRQSDAEFESLKESIREHGLMHPITVNPNGFILDGHHRHKACKELGAAIRYQIKDFGSDPALEKQFIFESNCARRNLTAFQKIELAYKMEPVYAELAKRRRLAGLKNVAGSSLVQNCTDDNEKGRAIDKCAKVAGISASTYNMARKILQTAPPEAIQALREDKASINEVYNKLQKQGNAVHQQQIRPEKAVAWLPKGVKLFHDDFRDIDDEIPDQSVDLVVTFPPLGQRSVWSYSDLMKLGKRVLKKDGGCLIVAAQQSEIVQVIELGKKAGLLYRWMLVAVGNCLGSAFLGISGGFEPILLFTNGLTYDSSGKKMISDVIMKGKTWMSELAPVAEYVVKNFSPENGVVCDPMMGRGDTAVAAIKLRRQFIGSEIESKNFEIAKRNVASLIGSGTPVAG